MYKVPISCSFALQVYGRLPFDDTNHKKLIKQAQAGVIFPSKPEISEKCKNLISKLLSKASDRIPMRFIKSDPWFKKQKERVEEKIKADKANNPDTEEKIISKTPISAETGRTVQEEKATSKNIKGDNEHVLTGNERVLSFL